jgi:alpha-mannosidase
MANIKEILCLHHSHLDIGYTHPQPLVMELQKDYIDQAIELCLKTADYPEESRFRWTCEATYPVLKWLETASEEKVETIKRLLHNGQMSIAAMMIHSTPLCGAEQMARMLYPIKELREKFGIPINVAINHDINGQPWPMSQILLDAGVDFYITGINVHFGGIPFKRPAVFRWETPDKRELLTFQGEHYSLFSQFFHTSMSSTKLMAEGIQAYVQRLEDNGYEHDFIFLTATNPPALYDNNCPDQGLASLIRKFNEEGHEQTIRFVTPEMLFERVKGINLEDVPVHAGDWTDYWNFGSGSSARETRINRKTKQGLKKADLLETLQGVLGAQHDQVKREAKLHADLFDEHTWGAAASITDPDHPEVYSQRTHKSHMVYKAGDLSAYVLGKQMELAAGNPLQSEEPEGVLLINTSSVAQVVEVTIPDDYLTEGRHLSAARIKQYLPYGKDEMKVQTFGTVELAPFSWRKIPLEKLRSVVEGFFQEEKAYSVSEDAIETPFYKLTFNPISGRIKQVYDKTRNWPMLDETSEWTFFEFVRESIDPLHHPEHRSTFFPRDIDKGNQSITVWNHEWKSKREGAERVVSWKIDEHQDTVSFVMQLEAAGVSRLEQRISFSTKHPRIELHASLDKEDVRTPESIYFAFPLSLQAGWRSHFDSAGMFIELDQEQLGTVSRDWVTVDQTVSVYDGVKGVTLACPDAPLVQIGDFNFGKESKSIERNENPLLLAWPMNNYWDTNFWISQPGRVQFKYELTPFGEFNPMEAYEAGVTAASSVEMNVAINCPADESGELFCATGDGIVPLYIKPAEDGNGLIVMLRNLKEYLGEFHFSVPGRTIEDAKIVNILEEELEGIAVAENHIAIALQKGELKLVRVVLG